MSEVTIRTARSDDLPALQRALIEAAAWRGIPDGYDAQQLLSHEYLVMYHEGWGRHGDAGVVAELDGAVVGAAYGRLFTVDRHGHGFVDEATPEIAIGVDAEHRGQGVGGRLLAALDDVYRDLGVTQLALSVEIANPAIALYIRHGYVELDRDENAMRMIRDLGAVSG